MKERTICLLLACLLLAGLLSACSSEDAAEMTVVPIGTEATETADITEAAETAEATEAQRSPASQHTAPTTEAPAETPTEASSETDPPSVETQDVTEAPPDTEAQTESFIDLRRLAVDCIGDPVSVLYAMIGYPPNGSYYYPDSATTEGPPVEIGELYYGGFTVYTFRIDGSETVVDVD